LKLLVSVCQRQAPSAEELLFPDDHPAVEKDLLRRVSETHNHCDPKRGWVKEHVKLYADNRLRWGCKPPCPGTAESMWFQSLTPYHQSLLILQQHRLLSQIVPGTASGQARTSAPTALGQACASDPTASGQAGENLRPKF
jgi:hypothetical protein